MRNAIVRLVINAAALWGAAALVGGVHLSEDFSGVVVVALVFGLVNALIKPLVKLLSLPLLLLTLGLFTVVINASMLLLTAHFTRHLAVDGFGAAVAGSLVVSFVSLVLSLLLKEKKKGSL